MKYIQKFWVQGCTISIQGLIKTITIVALLALSAGSLKAGQAITQLEFIQWLVQVTGETSQFTAASTAADYQQWALGKSLNPNAGSTLSRRLTIPVPGKGPAQ